MRKIADSPYPEPEDDEDFRLISCDEHGEKRPWYAVCVHVLDGAPCSHFERASAEEVGTAVCRECELQKDVESLRACCNKCTEQKVLNLN